MADYYSGNYDVDSFLAAKFIAEKAQDIYNEESIIKLVSNVRFLLISVQKLRNISQHVHGLFVNGKKVKNLDRFSAQFFHT